MTSLEAKVLSCQSCKHTGMCFWHRDCS